MNNEELSKANEKLINNVQEAGMSRRGFLHGIGGAAAFLGMAGNVDAASVTLQMHQAQQAPLLAALIKSLA